MATDVARNFENKEQRAINEQLARNNRQKTFYLAGLVMLILMTLAIILLIYNHLRRSSRHIRELDLKNDALNKAYQGLEQSHKENNRLMRVMAHDLRNPISATRNLLFSLLNKQQLREYNEVHQLLYDTSINCLNLINDLLNEKKEFSKENIESVNMASLLQNCVNLQQAKANDKHQQLKLEFEQVNVTLNAQKIWRAISNIIDNAIKFSPANSIIKIGLQKKEAAILISVRDNGIGMPEEVSKHIFSLPEKAQQSGTFGEESHGLGLSISKTIIEEHKGRIWFESLYGRGTSFYIELPLCN
ncbi:sensor histidine kinase [Foetidibacter luteolus]|uniref:sensor histidine kinase n=1 Tax=Foetidibacter luteolus TaxID=2608880 RepID=UPI001A996C0B|nr:HAMP domain-containing sensor histidine kinase [Foetidibacter luteolus]